MSRHPRRAGLPLSHYGAKTDFDHVIFNGLEVHTDETTSAQDLITYLEVAGMPRVGVLAPFFNGCFDNDRANLLACLSTTTIETLAAVARRGGDDLHPRSIGRMARLRKANRPAVLAYFGFLRDSRGRQVSFDEHAHVPVDTTDGELLAVVLFNLRHFADCRVTVNFRTPENLR